MELCLEKNKNRSNGFIIAVWLGIFHQNCCYYEKTRFPYAANVIILYVISRFIIFNAPPRIIVYPPYKFRVCVLHLRKLARM